MQSTESPAEHDDEGWNKILLFECELIYDYLLYFFRLEFYFLKVFLMFYTFCIIGRRYLSEKAQSSIKYLVRVENFLCERPSDLSFILLFSNPFQPTQFVLYVATKADEGLYNLYFHSCPNYIYPPKYSLNFNVSLQKKKIPLETKLRFVAFLWNN